ncbi:MAG: HNH endonuclease [Rickettsiaceae bacterium]|nr:HNH endonuclease [Rickettsiaceae bacterium]
MFTFIRNVKRAADFFSIHPEGLSFVTERRLKDVEASVNRLPKAIEDRTLTSIINLEYDVYELKQTIKSLQSKLDKEQVPAQLVLPAERTKTIKKPKPIKLQAVEEEVKKVKSLLTQAKVKRLFEYRDGDLYWKITPSNKIKKGDKAGSMNSTGYRQVGIGKNVYRYGRIIYLMFHSYLPECVSYIDDNPLNTRIENLRVASRSQIRTSAKTSKKPFSGYKGVDTCKTTGKYIARINKLGKYYHLGTFNTPQEAYKAYCKAAKKLHGEFARVA